MRALSVVVWIFAWSAVATAEDRPAVVVFDIEMTEDVAPSTAKVLNEVLLTDVQRSGVFGEVIGQSDIAKLLEFETQKQHMGCNNEACLAEIGAALGARFMFSVATGQVGERFVLTAKIVDTQTTTVVGRYSINTAPEEEELIAAIRFAVIHTLESAGFLTAEAAEAMRAEVNQPINWAPWIAAGAAGALGLTGVITGSLARSKYSELEEMAWDDPRRDDTKSSVQTMSAVADISFGLALAGAVTAGILFLLDGDEVGASTEVGVQPTNGGAAMTVGGTF